MAPFVLVISAVVAETPMAGMADYSASKAALSAWTRAAGRELRREGIRVIDARPPHTETGLAQHPIAGMPPRLPRGHEPAQVAQVLVDAVLDGSSEVPADRFGAARQTSP
jgi:cyclic-di-GMP-binding biofilm dispersal mediator protein